MASFEWPDTVVVVVYLVIVLGVALWASIRAEKNSSTGYFLAGRIMTWIPIGASTFATNVGAPLFLGLAGSSAATGLAVTMFEWHAMLMLLLLGWVFLPVYISSGCVTMPQYLKLRFGGRRIQLWLTMLYTILAIMNHISGQIYAGTVFVRQIFKWNTGISLAVLIAVTGLFTIIGGLTAVIWTDTVQTLVIIGGAATASIFALHSIGGFGELKRRFPDAVANYTTHVNVSVQSACGQPPVDAFHIFRSADDSHYPWPGMVFGLTILALYAWCNDQTCVQRSLSAKNLTHAKAGLVMAAYLKITCALFFVIPGMISRVLYPEEVACADPDVCEEICGNSAGCYDIAYPLLVLRVLPTGVRGLMMAALLSAMVSSLTSIFNSSATVFTMDLWSLCRPKAKESEKMIVGRVWILVMVIIGTLWIPVLQAVQGSQFWAYSQSISSFLLPPVVMTFLFGIFWKRATEQGAFWGMVVGTAVGVTRMALEWSRAPPPCGSDQPDTTFGIVSKVNYLHFAMISAAVTTTVIVVVSLLTKPIPEHKLLRVTFWSKDAKEFPEIPDAEDEISLRSTERDQALEGAPSSYRVNNPDPTGPLSGVYICCLRTVCGVHSSDCLPERRSVAMTTTSIQEDPHWRRIVNANAVVCACVCFFLHGYWA